MERKLIDYLPYAMRDFKEYEGIMESEQPEFDQAWNNADAVSYTHLTLPTIA